MPLTPAQLATKVDALLVDLDTPALFPWNGSSRQTGPLTITYQFETASPSDRPAGFFSGWTAFTDAQKTAVRDALAQYADVINVNFVETVGSADPDLNLGRVNLGSGGQGGFNYSYSTDGTGQVTSRVWDSYAVFNNTLALTDDPNLILHELGHALFLKHPGNYDAGGDLPEGPFLPTAEDNNKYSVMSYNAHEETGSFATRLMLYDIAALQAMWGADYTTRATNTVYFGPGSDPAFALANGQTATICIWDGGGGADRLDASNQTGAVTLDLRPGAFSTIGPVAETIAIAYGARIENATGGQGNDALIGNNFDNWLRGGAGRDSLDGGKGDDTVGGGNGVDRLTGRAGADAFDFNFAAESGLGAARDVIVDFSSVQDDAIDLSGIGSFDFRGQAGFTGDGAEVRWAVSGANSVVFADTDGDGDADLSVLVRGVTSLSATDFVL